ncbi:hypothetical protein F5Y06DRAFT_258716 [Hypoxylon sp. FL0890]|nr:hypothetical protein F5Y06DRAFT_258716 [Hypoxylon sp. FL0890]
MTGHMTSTGRGGAGNIADSSKSPKIQPTDLETPTLKTSVITTGRGGSGNMAPNRDPVETRARQDVGPVERRPSQGATHVGRGGAANVAKTDTEESETAKSSFDVPLNAGIEEPRSSAPHKRHSKSNGLATKAKEFFKKA